MTISTEHKQRIQDYYDGLLSSDQELELRQIVSENPDVAQEFNSMAMVVDSIKTFGFLKMLEGFQRKHFPDDASAIERAKILRSNRFKS